MSLRAEQVEYAYAAGRPVLRGVSAKFAAGAVTALLGPNGSGKSTLLRLLLGTLSPQAGRCEIGGEATAGLSAKARGVRLAFVPQRPTVWAPFKVREVVAMGRHAQRRDDGAVDAALFAMELSDRVEEPFGTLSVGQQQRAALARVLAQVADERPGETRAILADEPVAALDPRHALAALAALRAEAARGLAVVVVLHDLALAARYADRAVLLTDRGTVDGGGDAPAEEVLVPERLARVFGTGFRHVERLEAVGGTTLAGGV